MNYDIRIGNINSVEFGSQWMCFNLTETSDMLACIEADMDFPKPWGNTYRDVFITCEDEFELGLAKWAKNYLKTVQLIQPKKHLNKNKVEFYNFVKLLRAAEKKSRNCLVFEGEFSPYILWKKLQ